MLCVNLSFRWVNLVPIKVNIFAWRVSLDRLPTREFVVGGTFNGRSSRLSLIGLLGSVLFVCRLSLKPCWRVFSTLLGGMSGPFGTATVCPHRESLPKTRLLSETVGTISTVLGPVTAILVAEICFCSSLSEVLVGILTFRGVSFPTKIVIIRVFDVFSLEALYGRRGESVRAFATRYTNDTLQILGLHEDQRISGFVHGLRTRNLVKHLSTDLPFTYKGLMEKTYTWIEAKEVATNGAI
uniref:Uncharacterized protein n=1 Tax=Tanacetum cinerariifolium TaxID=118510 RepID=A0A699GR31_TANCI|nr:hypothetical protein [Tanacetum cinerariifolium]